MEGRSYEATLWMVAYKQRMAKYYNLQVKARRFVVRDLVLRKMSLVTQDLMEGKLRTNWEGPYWVTCCNRHGTYQLETI